VRFMSRFLFQCMPRLRVHRNALNVAWRRKLIIQAWPTVPRPKEKEVTTLETDVAFGSEASV
jgi:hypothetical protein